MKTKFIILSASICLSLYSFGQNLVPNPSFESNTACPANYGDFFATDWFSPTAGDADYLHTCGSSSMQLPNASPGYQIPVTGGGLAGMDLFTQPPFVAEYREYITVQITQPLTAGQCYDFSMHVVRANNCQYAIEEIGAAFTTADPSTSGYNPLPFTPQVVNSGSIISDTANWTTITGTFTAAGGESYLTIGNFNDDANTTYTQATTTGNQFAYYYFDDILLEMCDNTGLNELERSYMVYPNPFKDEFQVSTSYEGLATIKVYSVDYALVAQKDFFSHTSIESGNFASGIYIYEIIVAGETVKSGKITRQ